MSVSSALMAGRCSLRTSHLVSPWASAELQRDRDVCVCGIRVIYHIVVGLLGGGGGVNLRLQECLSLPCPPLVWIALALEGQETSEKKSPKEAPGCQWFRAFISTTTLGLSRALAVYTQQNRDGHEQSSLSAPWHSHLPAQVPCSTLNSSAL